MGELPSRDKAMVPDAKLVRHLLDHAHPDGGPKAKFLESFGFSVREPATLRAALVAHALSHDVETARLTDFGMIYEVVGALPTPDARNPFTRGLDD